MLYRGVIGIMGGGGGGGGSFIPRYKCPGGH